MSAWLEYIKAFSAAFLKQEQHCTASAYLKKKKNCFDKRASFEGKKDDPSFRLEHINFRVQHMIF